MTVWTPTKLLDWMDEYFKSKNIDAPRLSAEMLLSYVLKMQRIELYMNFNKPVPQDKLNQLRELVKQAVQQKPIAYMIGKTSFYSMDFKVNQNTLIPRPETEMLVEKAIEFLRKDTDDKYVLDLCTGSGCIACAIAKNHSKAKIIATDICSEALLVANENVKLHGLEEKIHLLQGDLFTPIIEQLDESKFDLIVSNPPYVTTGEYEELDKNVKDYEPSKALLAGADGLDVYKRIAEHVDQFLKEDGLLLLEIGYRQGDAVKALLESTGIFELIKVQKDFSDNDRVVSAYRKAPATSISEDQKNLL